MATEAELQQGILDVHGRRADWQQTMDQLLADAQAYSAQVRGRALPSPNALGQLPAGGARIEERVGGQELGDVRITLITGDDVAWQNLANKLQDTRARGDDELAQLELNLGDLIHQVRAAADQGGTGGPPPTPTSDPHSLLPWADYLATIIAYCAVFYGMMALANSFSLLGIFVVAGLLGLAGILQALIINPLRAIARVVIGGLVQILVDLVEFLGEWLSAVGQMFQGDLLRAILRIVLLAFAMWIFSEAQKIPAIKGVIDYAGNLIAQVTKWVNEQFDTVTGWIHDLRGQVRDSVKTSLGAMGNLGKQLQGDILGVVDQLFNGLGREVAKVRFEALGAVDLTRAALGATVTLMGQKFAVLPDEVRRYIIAYGRANPHETVAELSGLMAQAGASTITAADFQATPWDVLEEMTAQLEARRQGIPHDAHDRVLLVIDDILAVRSGNPPFVPELDLSTLQTTPIPGGTTVQQTPTGPVAPIG